MKQLKVKLSLPDNLFSTSTFKSQPGDESKIPRDLKLLIMQLKLLDSF